jgi:hypothetical protein
MFEMLTGEGLCKTCFDCPELVLQSVELFCHPEIHKLVELASRPCNSSESQIVLVQNFTLD